MGLIEFAGLCFVGFGFFNFTDGTIGSGTITVGEGIIGVQRDGFTVILDGLFILFPIVVVVATIVVCGGIIGVQLDGFAVILDGSFILFHMAVGGSPIIVCGVSVGVQLNGLVESLPMANVYS